MSEVLRGKGSAMVERAAKAGWEGVIAKEASSAYEPGQRSRSWLKLKVEYRQEFVVGGYTEPRNSRQHIGALLLGYYEKGKLIYAGHTGGGFTRSGLSEMYKRLSPLVRKSSPFATTPKTNERAHWVTPKIIVEVKFSEWTSDGRLRQPIFVGTRDDKKPTDVHREHTSVQQKIGTKAQSRSAA
jgi:bifunctional non-homologous end joining protein LigD